MKPISVRRSDMETFLECRQRWLYSHPGGHDLEVPGLNKATFLGSAVHKALEMFYRTGANPVETMNQWGLQTIKTALEKGWYVDTNELMDALVLGRTMLEGYLETWGDQPDNDRDGLTVLHTEVPFDVEIPGTEGGRLSGTVDGICRDQDGAYWVLETKTYTGSPPGNFNMNFQTLAYAWALDTMARSGHEIFDSDAHARVYGSVYNGLRKQKPGPRVEKPLFVRVKVFRSRTELNNFEQHLASVYREMTRPDLVIYPTITRNCEWCPFADPCHTRLTGIDETWLLDSMFTKHERPTAVLSSIDIAEE